MMIEYRGGGESVWIGEDEGESGGGSSEVVLPGDGLRMTDKQMIRQERLKQLDVTNG